MRVAVVTHYFPTSTHPWQGHSAYQTLKRLKRHCDLHVFCSAVTYPPLLRPKAAGLPADLSWRPGEVDVTYVPYLSLPLVSRPFNGEIIERKLLPPVRAYKPDLILSYVIYPPGYAGVGIAETLGIPSVLKAIGSDLNRMSGPFSRAKTISALKRATFVLTVSGDLGRTAVRLGVDPHRVRAILNGCDTANFHPRDRQAERLALKLDPEAEIVLYVGRLDPRKGLVELVHAIAQLRASRPRLQCHLIGDGPARKDLLALIAAEHCEDILFLHPSCRTEAVAQWMGACDLVTLPSYNEGCPNVVIEALNAGRPVVATNVGGIPELMDNHSGRLVAARDVPQLAVALGEVLDTKWAENDIAARNSRSWDDVADDMREVLDEALKLGPKKR